MPDEFTAAREVLKQNYGHLLDCANVVATGVGYKVSGGKRTSTLSIVCSVTEKAAAASLSKRDMVPKALESIPTDVVPVGKIRALQSRTARHRPAPGGVSIGHIDITAGTLGCLVKRDGTTFILSNNHVLANSNDAQVGDPILQPGPLDGESLPEAFPVSGPQHFSLEGSTQGACDHLIKYHCVGQVQPDHDLGMLPLERSCPGIIAIEDPVISGDRSAETALQFVVSRLCPVRFPEKFIDFHVGQA